MDISLEWLNDFVDLSDRTPDQLEHELTMLGLEAVSEGSFMAGEKLVVGEVLSVEKHANADKLSVCAVNVGVDAPLTIVCGAPNVAAGQRVPVALVGAVLPGDFEIGKRKVRGLASEGMICAEDELGLGDDHDGIMVLPEDAPIGTPLLAYLHLDSERLSVDLTPNRADGHSHLGAARDLAALLDRELKRPDPVFVEDGPPVGDLADVSIEDPEGCPRYVARVIQGVTIAPSPAWLAGRLRQVGIRPINNVVDATNYVLMAVGHPLHAFDYDRLAEHRVVVRAASDGESFTTLDDVERSIPGGSVMICDAERAVALGGIMGGQNSEISTTTTNVLLEAAYFNPTRIRRTSKSLGLSTEASTRFERGADYDGLIRAIDWCAALIQELGGGTVARGVIDVYPSPQPTAEIDLRWTQIPRILGVDIPRDEVARQMTALGCDILARDEETIRVRQPSWRPDLTREIDLIEEVARLWGYERIPTDIARTSSSPAPDSPEKGLSDDVRRLLVGMGLQEIVTSSLAPERHSSLVEVQGSAIELANYSSADMSTLRMHLLPGMLEVAKHNVMHRSASGMALFEVGEVFRELDGEYEQRRMVGMLMVGERPGETWADERRGWDYYDLKGVVETLVRRSALLDMNVVPYDLSEYVPQTGVRARIAEDEVGVLGQVSPALCEAFDLSMPVFYGQLDLAEMIRHCATLSEVAPLPRYPAADRDLALVVPESVSAQRVEEVVKNTGVPLLRRAVLFDVYRGPGLAEGEKSLGFNLEFRTNERTLTDQEVDDVMRLIVERTADETGARVRT